MPANPELIRLAEWTLTEHEKLAFVPTGAMDPAAAGGAPPGAPPGMPPGGAPPGAGAPPMPPDPAAGGAAPPPGGGGGDLEMFKQLIRTEIQQAMMGAGGAGGAGMGAAAKPAKMDPQAASLDAYQTKKLLVGLYKQMGLPLPDDIIDGPNRDPQTGLPMAPGAPGSTSDPARDAQKQPQQQSAIPPIEPMQPAMPQAPAAAGAPKAASDAYTDELFNQLLCRGTPVPTSTVGSRAGAMENILAALQRGRKGA